MPTYPTVYLTVAEADALAPSMLGLLQWSASSPTEKANALDAATKLIDGGLRYQGRKYDAEQSLQFPRVAYDDGGASPATRGADLIWDWNATTAAAVIPPAVQHSAPAFSKPTKSFRTSRARASAGVASTSSTRASPTTSPAQPPRPTARAPPPREGQGCPAARMSCWRRIGWQAGECFRVGCALTR